jgi:hypothetical protein
MYVINYYTQDIICLKNIQGHTIEQIKEIYKKLDGKVIKINKTYYPKEFIETLEFDNNVYKTTKTDLNNKFKQWLYLITTKPVSKSVKYAKDTINSIYTYSLICAHLPVLTVKAVNLFSYYLNHKKSTDEAIDSPLNSFQEEIPIEEIPIAEIPTAEIPIEEIPTAEIPIEEIPIEEIPTEEIPTDSSIEVLEKNNCIDNFYKKIRESTRETKEKQIQKEESFNAQESVYDRFLMNNTTDIVDGYIVYEHKKNKTTLYASIDNFMLTDIEKINKDMVYETNNSFKKFNMILRTYNTVTNTYTVSCFDDTYWQNIQDITSIGLDNIQIKDVLFFDHMVKLESLLYIVKATHVMNNYVNSVYKLRKLLCIKPEQCNIIKKVIQMIYSKYEYDFTSKVCLKSMYFNNKNQTKYDSIDYKSFLNIILYLGYKIENGHVLYIKELENPIIVEIPSFKTSETNMIVQKRNLQIRSEPPITIIPNISQWQVSSLTLM